MKELFQKILQKNNRKINAIRTMRPTKTRDNGDKKEPMVNKRHNTRKEKRKRKVERKGVCCQHEHERTRRQRTRTRW